MREKMPKVVKAAVLVACATLLLCVICPIAHEVLFIKSFLGHAEGLDHKAVVLSASVIKVISALFTGVIAASLVAALAFGKSWARKTYIVLAVLQLIGIGLLVVQVQLLSRINPQCAAMVSQQLQNVRWWVWINLACDLPIIVMLFMRSARDWYRADATAENKWKNRIQCLTYWVLMIVVGVVFGMVQGVARKVSDPKKISDKFPRIRVAELKARADLGDASSMWRLGNWERNGWLGEKHPDKAFEWYSKAADFGDGPALDALGDCYEKGIGTATNLEEAVACWMKAAEKKNGWAACKVALRHQKDKKQKEAFEWFQKSADLENNFGCCKLGECYEKGWGTETNAAFAAKWFLKGAERNHRWGMEKTGDFYRDGYGVEKDLDEAREWYGKAAKRGSKSAQKKLDALKKEEKPGETAAK